MVKLAPRKTLGTKKLTTSEGETSLHEVEACINSRPLTFVGEDPESVPLTPFHFLIGRAAGVTLESAKCQEFPVIANDLQPQNQILYLKIQNYWRYK